MTRFSAVTQATSIELDMPTPRTGKELTAATRPFAHDIEGVSSENHGHLRCLIRLPTVYGDGDGDGDGDELGSGRSAS
jgi:hypothetical protein